MSLLAVVLGLAIVGAVLWDALETIVLPRTVNRRFGLSTLNTAVLKWLYRRIGSGMDPEKSLRERLLGAIGPLSLLLLIGLWAWLLVFAISLIEWGLGIRLTP